MNYQLATLFGLGRLPGGGTWASLFVLIVTILSKDPSNTLLFFISITLLFTPAIYKKSLPLFSSKDPKEFVLDEVIGMALAINNQELLFFTTFIVFRIFDISKIGPVGWIDDPNTAPVWWSNIDSSAKDSAYMNVIGDDIMAALLTGIVVISILSTCLWVI
jgi:phosphatidylglycerophosphatase A